MDKYKFPSKPVANAAATVQGPNYRFTVISDIILRYEWSHDGVFEDRASTFAINRQLPVPKFTVTDTSDQLIIRTSSLQLTYDKKRFSPNGLHVSFINKMTLWGSEWRFGGPPDNDNLGGTARTLDGVDGRCDMGTGVLSRGGFSSIDDSDSMLFDGNGFVARRRPGDRIDGYLFSYGHNYKGAMRAYYALSGGQPQLPRWALGNWWSRYYAYSADEYLKLMDTFEEKAIPLSVAVIDMDWHLVQDDRVPHTGWTGYTWDEKLFPDPEAFGKELHKRNLKITLNDHPHAGIHHHEDSYEEMAKFLGRDISDKAPILFEPTSPEFVHAYLDILHRKLEKNTCDFWWIDWQQGAYSAIPGFDPLWLLNHFHFLDNALQSKDPNNALIFSRYGGPGSHRYPVGFSGDSVSTWESLRFQPEFTATASNIGYGWWSHDIGGHYGGARDDELATRWLQLGVFSPIMRLHSSNSPWSSKEPWRFRGEHEAVMTRYMRLRHVLLPYIHSMNVSGAVEHEPLVQPLYWTFPEREEAYRKPNEYYFGRSLVVAPVVHPRDGKTNHAPVDVWVPPGRHVDIFTGTIYDGDREMRVYRPLDHIPVLAAEGSIIPMDGHPEPGNGCGSPETYEVTVVVGADGEFTISEDAEQDARIKYDHASGKLEALVYKGSWTFKFPALTQVPRQLSVRVDGEKVDADVSIDKYPAVHGLRIAVSGGGVKNSARTLIIDLGPDPQLGVMDWTEHVERILMDYQTGFHIKDQLWAVWKSEQPVAVKVGRMLALGLDEAVTGPILELMLSDSRQK